MTRIIEPTEIPESLWNKDDSHLVLPQILIDEWYKIICRENLLEYALEEFTDESGGGLTKEETDKHFAKKFTGSCARIMLSLLDPNEELGKITNAYAKTFSGNKVFIVDIPCGAGAATALLLSVFSELRKLKCLPRQPLEIEVIGGEISESARGYAKTIWDNIKPSLKEQGINFSYNIFPWDITDKLGSTNFNQEIVIRSQAYPVKILLISNFSLFLKSDTNKKKSERQLEELFRYSRGLQTLALWIEPYTIEKNNKLIDWIQKTINSAFNATFGWKPFEKESDCLQCRSKAKHPLKDHKFNVGLVVMRHELPG